MTPAHYQRPLPSFAVPLDTAPEVVVDLQQAFEAVYEQSRLAGELDYARPISPPVDAEWLAQRLRERSGSSK